MKHITIGFFALLQSSAIFAKCEFAKVSKELLPLVQAFKASEKIILDEPLPKTFKSKSEEFIFRSKSKNWKGFDWKIRPLEVRSLVLAQEKYGVFCETFPKRILNEMVSDFTLGKIPKEDKKKFMRTLLIIMPCADGDDSQMLQAVTASEFNKHTEDLISLLVATESEAPQFAADYTACEAHDLGSKFILTDNFMRGMDYYSREFGIEKTLVLRLKRLRTSHGHFETAKYLFSKLETTLGI